MYETNISAICVSFVPVAGNTAPLTEERPARTCRMQRAQQEAERGREKKQTKQKIRDVTLSSISRYGGDRVSRCRRGRVTLSDGGNSSAKAEAATVAFRSRRTHHPLRSARRQQKLLSFNLTSRQISSRGPGFIIVPRHFDIVASLIVIVKMKKKSYCQPKAVTIHPRAVRFHAAGKEKNLNKKTKHCPFFLLRATARAICLVGATFSQGAPA